MVKRQKKNNKKKCSSKGLRANGYNVAYAVKAQVSVGWKEIHAVVERSPCIGIQMRLPWVTSHWHLTKRRGPIKQALEQEYDLTDTQTKYYTLLLEVRSSNYPRHLKIEIRKELRECDSSYYPWINFLFSA